MEIGLLIDSEIINKQHKVEDQSSVDMSNIVYRMGNKARLENTQVKVR